MPTINPWIHVIGVPETGLETIAQASLLAIQKACYVIGSKRHIAKAKILTNATCHSWESPLQKTIARLKTWKDSPVVILATGDPMHFGIGVTLKRYFHQDEIKITPAPSAFSLVAARMQWPIEETICLSLHGRPLKRLLNEVFPNAKIIALGNNDKTGQEIASFLQKIGYQHATITSFSNMNSENETCFSASTLEWKDKQIHPFTSFAIELGNMQPLDTQPLNPEPNIGNYHGPIVNDDMLHHDGKLTKFNIRAITLAHLKPFPNALLWDMGAGSGAISIEWSRAKGRAIAIEHNPVQQKYITQNITNFGADNITMFAGSNMDFLLQHDHEPPHAIFIGGGVSEQGLIEKAFSCLPHQGVLIANTVTLEGSAVLTEFYQLYRKTADSHLSRIALEHADPVGALHAMRPSMSILQLRIVKA